MKYSEFEREVEKLGFTHNTRCVEIVVKVHGRTVMGVSTNREYIVDSEWDEFQSLHKKTQGELFDLAYQLAKTPLAEREEEKRYWLRKIPVPLLKESDDLWYYEPINKLFKPGVDRDRTDNEKYKSIFTESEIAEMDIAGFEKVEVTE